MLINSECVAVAPSRQVALAPPRPAAAAGTRQLAGFGPGAVLLESGRASIAVEPGWQSGICTGGGNAAAGYLLGQLAGSPAKASPIQAGVLRKTTVQNSTDNHNNIQMTRLVPAFREGVGPHPGREPRPA